MDDIFNQPNYDIELINETYKIINKRFRNECLMYLEDREPHKNFNWTSEPKKSLIRLIDVLSENNNYLRLTDTNSDIAIFIMKLPYNKVSFPIKIIKSDTYPFRPPKLFINDIEYINFFSSLFYRSKYFDEVFKKQCMCCNNIICPEKWGPAFGFSHIFDEIYNIIQKINTCKELFFCDKIVELKFGHYIPIREFIF